MAQYQEQNASEDQCCRWCRGIVLGSFDTILGIAVAPFIRVSTHTPYAASVTSAARRRASGLCDRKSIRKDAMPFKDANTIFWYAKDTHVTKDFDAVSNADSMSMASISNNSENGDSLRVARDILG